ncbi:DNA-processing protein DprA [Burkholderia perseverans]|uniref:DNA-processing protein DprA n=1 Tax=Burkholderia perseverans TaxID=2615214 RepID=UPI003CC7ECA7
MAAFGPLAARRAAPMSEAPLTREALVAWLHLAAVPGLPAAAREALLRAFDSIEALVGADHATLAGLAGEAAARAVHAPRAAALDAEADAVHDWLAKPGHRLVTRHDAGYPPRFAALYDPPPLLYVKGDAARLHRRAVAIVGSRLATPQGRADATWFARALAAAGLVVVSGLARGIDAAAHRGALDSAAGTIAIVGTGVDRVYPAAHHLLAEAIAQHGAVLSEWPLGTPARAANFPQRNRLIAALCDGVLVVEAAPRSGSLITARAANDIGRDVFALPGSIHAPLARGCHALIRDGAKLVETPADVLEEFGITVRDAIRQAAAAAGPDTHFRAAAIAAADSRQAAPTRAAGGRAPREKTAPNERDVMRPTGHVAPDSPGTEPLPPDALALLDALGHGPVPADLLASRAGLAADALPHLLLRLELAGRVASLPGDRYQRLDPPPSGVSAAVLHSGDKAQPAPPSSSKESSCPR